MLVGKLVVRTLRQGSRSGTGTGILEGRFGVPFDAVPEHLSPVIELLPGYVEQLKALLAG